MPVIFKFHRGAESSLPVGVAGEPKWTTDTRKLFVGDGSANTFVGGFDRLAKSATYTVVVTDRAKVIDCTSGTFTVNLTAVATLGAGFCVGVYNSGSGTITIDPNASETIRTPGGSGTTATLAQGQGYILICDGSGWLAVAGTSSGVGVTDGDKTDVVVSSTGTVWEVESATKAFAFRGINSATLGTSQNDYDLADKVIAYIRATAAIDLTGIAGGGIGRVLILFNAHNGIGATDTITLKHESASSSANNRFWLPSSVDFALAPDTGVVLIYDNSNNRWRMVSQLGAAGGDLTGTYPNPTIGNNKVTYAKLQDLSATSRILGRKSASAGDAEECTLSEVLDFIGSTAQGNLLYRGASGWAALGAGSSAGQVLQTGGTGADPSWATTWVIVPKTADQSKTSDTTLANDSALVFTAAANSKYHVRIKAFYDTVAAADFKYALSTGAMTVSLIRVHRRSYNSGATAGTDAEVATVDTAATGSTSLIGTGTDGGFIEFDVILHVGGTGGVFGFQWAQDTSTASNTTVRAGSVLEYLKVA